MKKIYICLIILTLLITLTPSVEAKEENPRFILIYMDQNYNEGAFEKLAYSGITDFILLSLDDFNYQQSNYINQLMPRTFYTILKIIEEVPNANIWIGTPHMTSMTHPYFYNTALNKVYDYILEIKKSMPLIWEKNIKGIYMNTEAVIGKVYYSNINANYTISFMNDLGYRIHEYLDKEFLWIPYYGYGDNAAEVIKKLGYIANTTPIFDYILIQPHYFFDGDSIKNLDGVFYSVINQEICYRDKTPIISRTTNATAKIGFLIEVSSIINWDNTNTYQKRYNLYVFYYKGLRSIFPSGFYSGGAIDLDIKRIYNFYKANYYSEQLVDSINNFIE